MPLPRRCESCRDATEMGSTAREYLNSAPPKTENFQRQRCPRRSLRFVRYLFAGVELSAVGPTIRSGDESSTRFSRPETMTAGLRRSTLFPEVGQSLPDSEVENRGKHESSRLMARAESGARRSLWRGCGWGCL